MFAPREVDAVHDVLLVDDRASDNGGLGAHPAINPAAAVRTPRCLLPACLLEPFTFYRFIGGPWSRTHQRRELRSRHGVSVQCRALRPPVCREVRPHRQLPAAVAHCAGGEKWGQGSLAGCWMHATWQRESPLVACWPASPAVECACLRDSAEHPWCRARAVREREPGAAPLLQVWGAPSV